MTVVVAAVIENDRRFLVTRRPSGTHLAGLWEFPGGKAHPGETHEDALRREIREELEADVIVGPLVLSTTHTYPEKTVVLNFYACELAGLPRPLLGQEMRWVTRDEMKALGFPAADEDLIRLLVAERAPQG